MDKNTCITNTEEAMQKGIAFLEIALQAIRTGKASPAILSQIKIDYYGSLTLLTNVANVSVADAHTLTIQPWEKKLIPTITKAIQDANIGLQPINSGDIIRVPIPMLTGERRKELVKQLKSEAEKAKTVLRNARRDANDQIKKMQKDGLAEDEAKSLEGDIQKLTEKFIKQVDAIAEEKEREIMTI